MVNIKYTDELNVQILVALLKQHGIRYVVASPGTTNITFVASIQQDPYFEVFSSADERSASYIACGIAAETNEPVVLSCTGATASRNYIPGLTEAFYRKLPVLAVTSSQHLGRVGNLVPQVLDRSIQLNDICKFSTQCVSVFSEEDRLACETLLNKAILELFHNGGGPVHINLVTTYSGNFDVSELPKVHKIERISLKDEMPSLLGRRIAIYVGSHLEWSQELTDVVDGFCDRFGAVVFCDQTSNYAGKFGVMGSLVAKQERYIAPCMNVDVMIHIGEVSGAYAKPITKEVWRVSSDGEPRNAFNALRYVFDMDEIDFFKAYLGEPASYSQHSLWEEWRKEDKDLRTMIPDLPFSNIWTAKILSEKIPKNSVLHLGILNSLRSWNFFPIDSSIRCYSNTGGFGIDGCVSSLLGASFVREEKLFFGIVGDLAAFYDINALGNRHIGHNVRLLVVNNGVGTEFKNYNHKAAQFGDSADAYIAARGHYGSKSRDLLRHYATDLGFEYLSASTKEEFLNNLDHFVEPTMLDRPILFEIFTDSKNESEALKIISTLKTDNALLAKEAIANVIGAKGVNIAKKILRR